VAIEPPEPPAPVAPPVPLVPPFPVPVPAEPVLPPEPLSVDPPPDPDAEQAEMERVAIETVTRASQPRPARFVRKVEVESILILLVEGTAEVADTTRCRDQICGRNATLGRYSC
jgi:hypothetical protein